MMGTVEALKEPVSKPKFIEDMTEKELSIAQNIPCGLMNLGNTCYLNASLQCFKAIPELNQIMGGIVGNYGTDNKKNFIFSMRDVFKLLETSGTGVAPMNLLGYLRKLNPQFAQIGNEGIFMQQDAEECWSFFVENMQSQLKSVNAADFIDQHMTGDLISTVVCNEFPQEEQQISSSHFTKLNCHISNDVSQLITGLERGLVETFEKTSPSSGRMASYTKTSRISSLPKYLPINFIRFFWKQSEQIKAKILKKVQFPMILDLYSLCTPELQQKMLSTRDLFKKFDEQQEIIKKGGKPESSVTEEEKNSLGKYPCSGMYELIGVLTHVGRSADSGHYIGWTKRNGNWWKFDDEKVTKVNGEDILKLDGGGDWHTAYMLLYRQRQFN